MEEQTPSTPDSSQEFPEGFDPKSVVRELAEELNYRNIIDFGCGSGRLCEGFRPEHYLGIDIDEGAIQKAKEKFSKYTFMPITDQPKYADVYLAYDVFKHLQDKDLHNALKNIRCNWLILGEILGEGWKNASSTSIYPRELSDYIQILRSHDLILHKHVRKPFKKYADSAWYQNRNTDMSFLVFRKCLKSCA